MVGLSLMCIICASCLITLLSTSAAAPPPAPKPQATRAKPKAAAKAGAFEEEVLNDPLAERMRRQKSVSAFPLHIELFFTSVLVWV